MLSLCFFFFFKKRKIPVSIRVRLPYVRLTIAILTTLSREVNIAWWRATTLIDSPNLRCEKRPGGSTCARAYFHNYRVTALERAAHPSFTRLDSILECPSDVCWRFKVTRHGFAFNESILFSSSRWRIALVIKSVTYNYYNFIAIQRFCRELWKLYCRETYITDET